MGILAFYRALRALLANSQTMARSRHSVGGAECRQRAFVVWDKPCGSQEMRAGADARDSTSRYAFVTTTRTTSRALFRSPPVTTSTGAGATLYTVQYCRGNIPFSYSTVFGRGDEERLVSSLGPALK